MRSVIAALVIVAAAGPALAGGRTEKLYGESWLKTPTDDEIKAAAPVGALAKVMSAHARVDCAVGTDGGLSSCKVIEESPLNMGFGAAALSLAPKFQHKPTKRDGHATFGVGWTNLPDPDTEADWLKRPEISAVQAMFPEKAVNAGLSGRALIRCIVTVDGSLRDCWIRSEDPEGYGFGEAALALQPSFRMKSATLKGRPVEATVTIPINWSGGLSAGSPVRIAPNLLWERAPSSAEVAAAYPKTARAKGLSIHVVLRCAVAPDGHLKDCVGVSSNPSGFGSAANSLTSHFQARTVGLDAKVLKQLRVNLSFQFDLPTEAPRYLGKAEWTQQFKPDAMLEAYPDKAAAAGVEEGRAVLDCVATSTGALTDCKAISETPEGMDFGIMAVKLAGLMMVNPWTEDGLPADGAHLRFALKLVHKEPDAPPKP